MYRPAILQKNGVLPHANEIVHLLTAFNATNNSSTSASASAAHDPSPSVGLGTPKLLSITDDPMRPLLPQYQVVPPTTLPNKDTHYASSQVSWSPDGKWLIAVGDQDMMVVFRRGA